MKGKTGSIKARLGVIDRALIREVEMRSKSGKGPEMLEKISRTW